MEIQLQPNTAAALIETPSGFSRWSFNFNLKSAIIPGRTMRRNPHFHHLESAYQLHFYLCFKTHYLRPIFATGDIQNVLGEVVEDVCRRYEFHLLEANVSAAHLRVLLSLKPQQTISRAAQLVKGNLSRQFNLAFPDRLLEHRVKSPWAEGYFARSSGKVNLDAARRYVESQVAHHGYRGEWTDGLTFKNENFRSPAFNLPHCLSILNYHLVLVTDHRAQLFEETIAPRLFDYVMAVGARRGFAVDRMSILPDHVHLIIEALPSVSIYDCALALMNNTAFWMEKNFRGVLKGENAWNVWQPSFYAGTVGEYSTAQVRRFLG